METTCPHCSQVIEFDKETLQSLEGASQFQCPACAGAVAVPATPGRRPVAPVRMPGLPPASHTRKSHQPTLLDTHRGINRNLLILGSAALLVLGGLAAFIASRKGGNIFNTKQNTTNEIIHNSYFTQLIASGATTEKDLQALAEIRPYGSGFIGVSKEALPWPQAQDYAKRAVAEILAIEDSAAGSKQQLIAWLPTAFPSQLSSPVWVRENGEACVLDGPDMMAVKGMDRPRKVLVGWNKRGDNSPAQPAPDLQRKLAESILMKGGKVAIWQGPQVKGISQLTDLPPGEIDLEGVDTYGGPAIFSDEDSRLMAGCKRLRNIRIHNGSMTSIPFVSLPALSALEIAGGGMNTADFKDLANCRNLKNLNLYGVALDGGICSIAAGLPLLEELYLPGNRLRAGDLAPLAVLKRLRNFGLPGGPITDMRVLDDLPSMETMEGMRLDGLNLPNADLRCLSRLRGLATLTLWNESRLSTHGWANVAAIPGLKVANLMSSNIADNDLHSFSGHKTIERFDLNDTTITGEGFAEVVPLINLTSISIGLYKDHVTDAGVDAILRACPNLATLDLYGKLLTHRAVAAISESKSLRSVCLKDALLLEDSWMPLLAGMTSLSELTLRSALLTDAHVHQLTPLKDSLITLDIQKAGMTDQCVNDLAEFKKLKTLDVTASRISKAGLVALRAALPGCNVIH